jgi:hypothetical protein
MEGAFGVDPHIFHQVTYLSPAGEAPFFRQDCIRLYPQVHIVNIIRSELREILLADGQIDSQLIVIYPRGRVHMSGN